MALADEVAAAAGLVMAKDARVPVALVRGVDRLGAPDGPARDLVRPADEDLFRSSPLQALHDRRTIRAFGAGAVSRDALEEAIAAAATAPAPHHTRPWRFSVLTSEPIRRAYLSAMARAWRADLRGDETPEHVIERRVAASDAVLGTAPVLIVPWLSIEGGHTYADAERSQAEREMFVLSGGAAIQNLLLALSAQGLASAWISSSIFCREEARAALGMPRRLGCPRHRRLRPASGERRASPARPDRPRRHRGLDDDAGETAASHRGVGYPGPPRCDPAASEGDP